MENVLVWLIVCCQTAKIGEMFYYITQQWNNNTLAMLSNYRGGFKNTEFLHDLAFRPRSPMTEKC
jgi:hypothetical protein